jgi:hypothetical protein
MPFMPQPLLSWGASRLESRRVGCTYSIFLQIRGIRYAAELCTPRVLGGPPLVIRRRRQSARRWSAAEKISQPVDGNLQLAEESTCNASRPAEDFTKEREHVPKVARSQGHWEELRLLQPRFPS